MTYHPRHRAPATHTAPVTRTHRPAARHRLDQPTDRLDQPTDRIEPVPPPGWHISRRHLFWLAVVMVTLAVLLIEPVRNVALLGATISVVTVLKAAAWVWEQVMIVWEWLF